MSALASLQHCKLLQMSITADLSNHCFWTQSMYIRGIGFANFTYFSLVICTAIKHTKMYLIAIIFMIVCWSLRSVMFMHICIKDEHSYSGSDLSLLSLSIFQSWYHNILHHLQEESELLLDMLPEYVNVRCRDLTSFPVECPSNSSALQGSEQVLMSTLNKTQVSEWMGRCCYICAGIDNFYNMYYDH